MKSKTLNIDQYKSLIISLLFHSLIILFIVFIQNMKFNDLNKENKSFKKYFETSYEIALQFEEENKNNKINIKFLFNNKQELRKNKKDISNSMNLSSKKIEFKSNKNKVSKIPKVILKPQKLKINKEFQNNLNTKRNQKKLISFNHYITDEMLANRSISYPENTQTLLNHPKNKINKCTVVSNNKILEKKKILKKKLELNKVNINIENLLGQNLEFKKLLFRNHINITQLLKYQTQKIKTIKCFKGFKSLFSPSSMSP